MSDTLSDARRGSNIRSVLFIVFGCLSIFLFVLLSALLPANGDTQIYHLQIIQWQTRFKVVPGIANLYPRFGLGSNWFNLISFFYWPAFKHENFTYLNAAFVIWFFIWLFSKWNFYFNQKDTVDTRPLSAFYFLLLVYCLFDWQLFRDSANSTNYDFATNAFTIIICSFFIEAVVLGKSRDEFSFAALLFSLCAISFKLSGIFLLLLVLYHLVTSRQTVRWLPAISIGIAILLPVLTKNYIITGYPLFPSSLTINDPDWRLPKPMTRELYQYIVLSNRFYNYQWSFAKSFNATTFNWIPYWVNGILWKHRVILAMSLLSMVFFFKKPNLLLNHKQLKTTILIFLLMIVGWFFTAPDPGRFGYGILLSTAFLTLSLFVFPLFTLKVYQFILLVTIVGTVIYIVRKATPILDDPHYLVYPMSFKEPPYQPISVNEISVKLPEKINGNWDCRCYFLPLPCITQKNPYLKARGNELKEGFRMYPPPDSGFTSSYLY